MKNLKKLLAVIVSICVLATFTVPAFAETKTEIQICQDLGMVQGTTGGVTDAYKASTPARYQAAIIFLRLKGLEDEATAFIPTENFSDLAGLNETNKAILGYLKANPDLGFEGYGDNKFRPLQTMTAKEYYKVLLTALGYKEGTDFTWANLFQFAASKGLYALVDNSKFTINDLAIGTVEALKVNVKGGTTTLLATLVDAGAITAEKATATGFYTATPKTLTLVSATTDNLKTVKFLFNKDLNKDTVKKDNFSNTLDAKLLDDKRTVIAVVANKKQSDTLDITIDGVKDTDGIALPKTTQKVTFVDTAIPVISGVTLKNAKTIVVSASEPMAMDNPTPKMFTDIKIDGNPMTAYTTVDYAKNTVTFNLTSLLSKGTHKIDISKMQDYADYTAVATSFNFDVPEDVTAPEITAGKLNNINEIEVTFNEDVDTIGSFYIQGSDIALTSNKVARQDDHSVFKLTVDTIDIRAIVEVKVEYKGQKDVNGNEVKDKKAFKFTVADDTTLPTVTAKIDSGNKIVLTFSKTMIKAGKVKVYKSNGTDQLGSDIDLSTTTNINWKTNNTVCEIAAAAIGSDLTSTDAKDIVVKVSGMKDATIRQNTMIDTSFNLKAVDTQKPLVAANYKITPDANNHDNDTITFYFTEAMDNDTLQNLSNYIIASGSGSTYVADKTFAAISNISLSSVASDSKSVVFKAKSISTESGLKFKVYPLKDLAGNYSDTTLVATQASGNLAVVGNALAKEEKKIEITFNEKVGAFDPSVFVVRQGPVETSTWSAFVTSYSIDANKVTLTLSDSIGTTTQGCRYLVSQNENLAKDIYGQAMADTTIAVALTDNIKPTAKVEQGTVAQTIVVKFSEGVDLSTAKIADIMADLTVRKSSDNSLVTLSSNYDANTTLNNVVFDDTANTITISGLTTGTEYKVSILNRGSIVDDSDAHNALAELSAATATAK